MNINTLVNAVKKMYQGEDVKIHVDPNHKFLSVVVEMPLILKQRGELYPATSFVTFSYYPENQCTDHTRYLSKVAIENIYLESCGLVRENRTSYEPCKLSTINVARKRYLAGKGTLVD